MKNILFATTAIVAAGAASTASAAEWETTVGGYYFLGLAVADGPGTDGNNGVGVLRDGEFVVEGNLTADNGLLFTAHVEVEAFTSGDQIDENWGAVRGSFGRVKIGGDDDAAYAYSTAGGIIYAPGARIGTYDTFRLVDQVAFSVASNSSDDIGIHYDSPNFSGFQVGATYIPNVNSDAAGDTNNPSFANGDFYSVGALYDGDFGNFGFKLGGGYFDNTGGAAGNNDGYVVGATVSAAGFSLAGLFEDDDIGEEYVIGAQYATGPWTVAGSYTLDEFSGGDNDIAAGWVTYAIAPGVLGTVGVEYASTDSGAAAGRPDLDSDGDFGGLAFLTLRF